MDDTRQVDLEELLGDGEPREAVAEPSIAANRTDVEEPGPSPEEPQHAELADQPTVPRRALEDERRKRQEYERRIAELEARIKPQAEPQPPPHIFDDPDAWQHNLMQQQQRALFETRAELTREVAMAKHEDYEEAEAVFAEAAKAYPQLAHEMVQSPNPARYVYEMGKRIKLQTEIGNDPVAYERKLREKWEAELAAQSDQAVSQPTVKAPKSLASVPSAPSKRDDKGRYAPVSLSEILDD